MIDPRMHSIQTERRRNEIMFAENLQALRKQKGWSQEQLADAIGVTRQTVSKWELGSTTPELEKLLALSQLFAISLDELTGNPSAPAQSKQELQPVMHGAGFFGGMGMRPYFHYEYKSKRTLFGLPLVHIHLGWGFCHAKGILAIGNVATGLFAFGGVALGLFALGGVSLGLLALGGLALGLLAAVGGLAIGAIAVGGLAVGLLALGGLAVGVYAMGGAAIASQIAAGDYAQAAVAIGNSVLGDRTFAPGELSPGQLAAQLKEFLPQTPDWILNLFAPFCSR